MPRKLLEFLRPSLYALLAVAVLTAVVTPWSRRRAEAAFANLAAVDAAQLTPPTADLSPEDVVRLQLDGLADPRTDGAGIMQCFLLASPDNRTATGPVEHFAALVRSGPFAAMAHPRSRLVGAAQVEGPLARVLATLLDADAHLQPFVFILRKQTATPFADCWMTEAVLPQ